MAQKDNMFLYRNILSQAWKNTWQNKYLWFFGLFAVLLVNNGGTEIFSRLFSEDISKGFFSGTRQFIQETNIFSLEALANLGRLAKNDPLSLFIIILIFLAILAILIFLLWMSTVSQAAIVNNAAKFKTNKEHSFKNGFEIGKKKFWPVLGLNAVLKVIIYLLFLLMSLPVFTGALKPYFNFYNITFIISFLIFVPLAFCFSYIMKYAISYVVIKENKFLESIKLGWELFKKNWLVSLEMAFVLFLVNFLASLLLILLLMILAVPFLFIALLFSQLAFYTVFWVVILSALLLFIVFMALVGAILTTFQVSSWTLLFVELIRGGGKSKLVRIFNK